MCDRDGWDISFPRRRPLGNFLYFRNMDENVDNVSVWALAVKVTLATAQRKKEVNQQSE